MEAGVRRLQAGLGWQIKALWANFRRTVQSTLSPLPLYDIAWVYYIDHLLHERRTTHRRGDSSRATCVSNVIFYLPARRLICPVTLGLACIFYRLPPRACECVCMCACVSYRCDFISSVVDVAWVCFGHDAIAQFFVTLGNCRGRPRLE